MPADIIGFVGSWPPAITALGIGVALAGAPGPVQAVLLAESLRGGVARGLQALAGASLTFGALLAAAAVGLSVASLDALAVRTLQLAGGSFLVWMAYDGLRAAQDPTETPDDPRRDLPPLARGSLSVLLNPGAWLFIAAIASPLMVVAKEATGTPGAFLVAGALMGGAALGDLAIVVVVGGGLRRAGAGAGRFVRRVLAVVLALLGLGLMVGAVLGDAQLG